MYGHDTVYVYVYEYKYEYVCVCMYGHDTMGIMIPCILCILCMILILIPTYSLYIPLSIHSI